MNSLADPRTTASMLSRLGLVLTVLAVVLVAGIAAGEVHSFDLFWQLQSGKHIWQTGQFLYQDTFSLAAENFRYEHCWLHDLIFYGVHHLAGFEGISLFKGFLVALSMMVAVQIARVRGATWPIIFLSTPVPVIMTFWAWKERPQLWSYLGMLILIWLIEKSRGQSGPRWWVGLGIMALWANLHAGYVLIFPLLAAYLAGEFIDRRRAVSWAFDGKAYRKLWLTAACVPVAALLTPYGTRPFRVLFAAPKLGETSDAITQIYNIDWLATTFSSYPGYFYLMALAGIVVLTSGRNIRGSDVFLLGGLAYMGLTLERHTPFFLLAAAALLPWYVEEFFGRFAKVVRCDRQVVAGLCLLLGSVALFFWLKTPLRNQGFFQTGLREWHYPIAEASFVKSEQLPPRLFNTYAAGGYLMWTLYPDYLVFYDGRQTSPELFRQGLLVESGRPGWEKILAEHDVNTLVLEACSQADGRRLPLLDRLRHHPAWLPVFAGETHLVFVRSQAVDKGWAIRHRLPVGVIDNTILSAAQHLLQVTPLRRQALWEVARISAERGSYRQALEYLTAYLKVTPKNQIDPQAAWYQKWLAGKVGLQQ